MSHESSFFFSSPPILQFPKETFLFRSKVHKMSARDVPSDVSSLSAFESAVVGGFRMIGATLSVGPVPFFNGEFNSTTYYWLTLPSLAATIFWWYSPPRSRAFRFVRRMLKFFVVAILLARFVEGETAPLCSKSWRSPLFPFPSPIRL